MEIRISAHCTNVARQNRDGISHTKPGSKDCQFSNFKILMSNVGFILFGFPQEIYMAKYERRKYDRKPLVTNTVILSQLSNADYHPERFVEEFCKVKRISDGKTNEDLNRSFFRLKNLGGLATISEQPATSVTYH